MSGDTKETLARYRDTLVRWGEALNAIETHRANALFDASHELFKVLRDDPEGRAGISALMDDPNPYVRSTAAAHSLLWAPKTALGDARSARTGRFDASRGPHQRRVRGDGVAGRAAVI